MSRIFWIILFCCICSARISSAVTTNAPCPCRRLNECPFNYRITSQSAASNLSPCEADDFVRCCESTQETVARPNVDGASSFRREIPVFEANGTDDEQKPVSGPLRRLVEFMRNGVFGFMKGSKKSEVNSVPYVTEIQASVPLTISANGAGPRRSYENTKYYNTRNPFLAGNTDRIVQRPVENYPENVGMNILNNVNHVMVFMDDQGTSEETVLKTQPIRVRILNDSPAHTQSFHDDYSSSGYGKMKISDMSDEPKNVRFDQPNVEENHRPTEEEDSQFPNDEDDQSPPQREIEEIMNFESLRIVPKKAYHLSSHNQNTRGQLNQFTSYPQTGFLSLRELKSLDSRENAFTTTNFGNSGEPYETADANIPTMREARSRSSYYEGESNFRSTSKFTPKKVNNFPKQKTSLETFLPLDRASVQASDENTPNLMSIHEVSRYDHRALGDLLHSEESKNIKRLARSHSSHVKDESSVTTEENSEVAVSDVPNNSARTQVEEGHKRLTNSSVHSRRRRVRIRDNKNKVAPKIRRVASEPSKKEEMIPSSATSSMAVHTSTTRATTSQTVEVSTNAPVRRFKRPPRILPAKGGQADDQKSRRGHVSFEDSRQRTLDLLKSSEKRKTHMASAVNRGFKGRKINAMKIKSSRGRNIENVKNDTNSDVKTETSASVSLIKDEEREETEKTSQPTVPAFNSGNTLLESDENSPENDKPIGAGHQGNRARKLHSSNASESTTDVKVTLDHSRELN